ncbi:MAG: TraG/TraD/VirD4 family protein [Thermoplasmata archaeon]|nr:TraG/TraD/VirD4 family protein [Thermoplasmata archaeon]
MAALLEGEESCFGGWSEPGRAAARRFYAWSRSRREEGEGARRLLGEITRSSALRRLLCSATPDWSLDEVDRPHAITVVSGGAAELGESGARLLLGVYLALLWSRLLSRRPDQKLFLVLDELQWYAHGALSELLRLGRRYNIHVYAATQSLASLPEGVQEPLRTNVADFLLFRGDPGEAREFSRWLPSLPPERLLALARGRAVLLEGKGSDLRWIRTVAPIGPKRRTAAGAAGSEGAGEPKEVPMPAARTSQTPNLPVEPAPGDQASLAVCLRLAEPLSDGGFQLRLRRLESEGQLTRPQIRALGRILATRGLLRSSGKLRDERIWALSALPTVTDRSAVAAPSPERKSSSASTQPDPTANTLLCREKD